MTRTVHAKPQETEVRKFTMSGARVEDIESRLLGIIGTTRPNTLIIHVGTNNLIKDHRRCKTKILQTTKTCEACMS